MDRVPVDKQGLADALTNGCTVSRDTRFTTLMLANNETGAIQPVGELGGAGSEQVSQSTLMLYRPSAAFQFIFTTWGHDPGSQCTQVPRSRLGIGLLLVRSGVRLGSRLFGGGQQQGRRPGTIAVPLVVGLATALSIWHDQSAARARRWAILRPA